MRQFLLECPDTCDLTCYHFECDGKELNDYMEIAEMEDILQAGKATLKAVPGMALLFFQSLTIYLHVILKIKK